MIYFDSAASYPILPEVKTALRIAFDNCFANSTSSHDLGEQALAMIDAVREKIADHIGAYPSEIIFTSGATESNNIAFKSVLLGNPDLSKKRHVVISAIEHKCIFSICNFLKSSGFTVSLVKPNACGIIDAESVKKVIREDTGLVSVMHVNNELGTVNPIAEIGQVCFDNKILFHSDAAQSLCKQSIDVDAMNVDIMSFSAHKIGGPKGIGAVYIRDLRKRPLQPVIHGAGQEQGIRGGTVAAPLIIGFGAALAVFPSYYKDLKKKKARDYLIEKLEASSVNFIVNGNEDVLPHMISLSLPKTNTSLLLQENSHRFCLAQGSACSSREIEASHVLTAIGLNREIADRTLRISFTNEVVYSEIDELVKAINKAAV